MFTPANAKLLVSKRACLYSSDSRWFYGVSLDFYLMWDNVLFTALLAQFTAFLAQFTAYYMEVVVRMAVYGHLRFLCFITCLDIC
jgi:hypothetical protein